MSISAPSCCCWCEVAPGPAGPCAANMAPKEFAAAPVDEAAPVPPLLLLTLPPPLNPPPLLLPLPLLPLESADATSDNADATSLSMDRLISDDGGDCVCPPTVLPVRVLDAAMVAPLLSPAEAATGGGAVVIGAGAAATVDSCGAGRR